jgi:two-component system phosphate regulon sensor histidine kinase PhoR
VRLTTRLLLGVLGVVGVLVLFMVFVVDRQLSRRLQDDTADVLAREARFVASSWAVGGDPYDLSHRAGTALGRRVTLISPDGTVLGDSDFDRAGTARLENHASRPEVVQAREQGQGSALRFSTSRGEMELYVAVRTQLGVARVAVPTASLDAVVATTRRDIAGAGAVALIIALGLAWLFARNISRPIIALRDVAATIASGDLSPRPALRAPGEVGELARALHQVAEQLSTRLQALQADESLLLQLTESLNEGVIAVDTTRRVVRINENARLLLGVSAPLPFPVDALPTEVGLRASLDGALAGETTDDVELVVSGRTLTVTARPLAGGGAVMALFDLTRLRRLEAVRRNFVANVSHELRTPLTVIGGFAETLVSDDLPKAERKQFTEKIISNTRRMQRLVDDLLDLSRIELGGWVPSPVNADIESIAGDALTSARELASKKKLTLHTELAAGSANVWADPMALRQIIGNLVDNSVRHTATGTVTVFSRPREGGGVVVGVRDTGIGIAPEHLPRIFERFYRVDKGRARDEGGTGLGLAIVKHLVEAHGGKVRAESEVGRGTTILASFPGAPQG